MNSNNNSKFYLIFNLTFLIICTIITSSLGQSLDGKVNGWLRVCSSSEDFAYHGDGDSCEAGFWLKKPLKVQCVCGHGIWYLGDGYCDKDYMVLVAWNGTCFPVPQSKTIRWIKQLGNSDAPFSSYYFVSNLYLDRIEENKLGEPESKFDGIRYVAVGSIFPTMIQQDESHLACIVPRTQQLTNSSIPRYEPKDDYDMANVITDGAPDSFNLYRTEAREGAILRDIHKFAVVKACTMGINAVPYSYQFGVRPGFYFLANNYLSPEIAVNNYHANTCEQTCTPDKVITHLYPPTTTFGPEVATDEPTSSTVGNSTDTNSTASANATTAATTTTTTTTHKPKSPTTAHPGPGDCIEPDPKWNKLNNKTLNGIQAQTKRMLMTQINYALFKQKAPELELTEYNLFQKSRRIFEKICPKTEVPQPVLRGVLRMFRQLLQETQDKYPYFRRGDEVELTRINEALRTCYDTEPENAMTFVYNEKACPKKFLRIDIKLSNGTNNASGWIPCEVRFNSSKHDFPVEVAWKMIMFTHYFCAPYFAQIGYDHSRYLTKMSEMFNRAVKHRWYFHLNSYEAISFVFQAYNLTQIGKNIDRCVGAAHKNSNYTGWIKRPEYVQYCRDPEAHEYKNLTPDERKKIKSKPAQKRFKGISKLPKPPGDAPGFLDKAYCLKHWFDPLVKLNYLHEAERRCTSAGAEFFWTDPKLGKNADFIIPGLIPDPDIQA